MLNDIKIAYCRLSEWILLPKFIFVSIHQMFKRLPRQSKEILFTLDDDRLYRYKDGGGRYAYLIMNMFSDSGYNVYLYKKMGFLSYIRLGIYGQFIYSIKNLKVITRLPQNTENIIYAFDEVYNSILDRPWKKLTYVNVLKPSSCKLGELIAIPYFMHAFMYRLKQLDKIEELRKTKRTLRVFFGGNTETRYYRNPLLRSYGQMTRLEGIETVLGIKDKVKTIQKHKELRSIIRSDTYINGCRLLRTDHKITTLKSEWLEIVSKSDFFLCFSGTDLPMCHHTIEAMAVGTIPIISYQDWFFPTLEHRKNAIIYSGKEDLVKKMEEVFAFNAIEIKEMRKNVIDYYDQHLGAKNFIRKYEAQKDKVNTIILHPRLIGTNSEIKEGQRIKEELKSYFGNKD